jgi:S-adenosylmethionine hydrolase
LRRARLVIVLFTDFGADDIYVAQVKAVLHEHLPAHHPVLDLLHRVPSFDIRAGAHLLAALEHRFPAPAVFLAVVDPGVGGDRGAVIVDADGKSYVGPDNGLLSVVAARAAQAPRTRRIVWRPSRLAVSFHGRDLFAPVAARLAAGDLPAAAAEDTPGLQVRLDAGDLAEVIYVDHYGNAITGLRAAAVPPRASLRVRADRIPPAAVFSAVPEGAVFWYPNSIGMAEIAANRASAAQRLGLAVGERVAIDAGNEDARAPR